MEMLSVIAGNFKNRKIEQVQDTRTKYTPSKVKNAVFSILESKRPVQGSSFLDLCAGSGQMGFEALSRGASFVTFVDISGKAIKTLKKNVDKLKVSDEVRIYKQDVIRFLQPSRETYDIIFLDPPFNEKIFNRIIQKILNTNNLLKENGRIIIESLETYQIDSNENYYSEGKYSYSSVKIEFLKRKG